MWLEGLYMDLDVLQKIEEADLVLVGLGEEFDCTKLLKQNEEYNQKLQLLDNLECKWLLPLLNQQYMAEDTKNKVKRALEKLADVLQNKNYFVVSTSTNPIIKEIQWKENRLVTPCGSYHAKQCSNGCTEMLQEVSKEDVENATRLLDYIGQENEITYSLGKCSDCEKPVVFNNIYAPEYNENGYKSEWELYTKWLQGTLNKKLLVLELGVNMQFPTVIRFPFEKVTFFNQKAFMYRVNEKLYFLSEELNGKGQPISENAVDWLIKE